jgi:alpha-ketoglutarate-dependent taurine dioxygenase
VDEGRALLKALLDHVTRPEFCYRHEWREGDLVVWDNRCVLHRARPYDYREVRVMRHTRVAGDPATELAPTDRDERASAYEPSTSNR